ncbi:MAG: Txe/YoeB family addiction module toxin [Verrucomicrobiota bacterium]
MNLSWTELAWEQYLYWQNQDKRTLKRINVLIKDTLRNPFDGLGKPEPLKGLLGGCWSKRIDEKNRLVYQATDTQLLILQCRFHYDDK